MTDGLRDERSLATEVGRPDEGAEFRRGMETLLRAGIYACFAGEANAAQVVKKTPPSRWLDRLFTSVSMLGGHW
jgi:hypothetical protein